jgi:hypothetical protein
MKTEERVCSFRPSFPSSASAAWASVPFRMGEVKALLLLLLLLLVKGGGISGRPSRGVGLRR